MTEKQIRDEAMRKVMWEVGHTNNDVTRYISDAVANQVVRDESGGWIPVTERLPTENEYRVVCSAHSSKPFLKRFEIAYITDTTEYQFGYYDGYKWIDKCYEVIQNVVAWKNHEPFIQN